MLVNDFPEKLKSTVRVSVRVGDVEILLAQALWNPTILWQLAQE